MAENFKNLTIGINIKKEKGPIYLSDSSRKSSTLVIGTKNSGKRLSLSLFIRTGSK